MGDIITLRNLDEYELTYDQKIEILWDFFKNAELFFNDNFNNNRLREFENNIDIYLDK
tara:strand:+ start:333 stop:506 length:174 start_codon:yes stop_codon:yes gene_type:complete